jgi:chaperonin cofactor prefoldin
MSRYLDELDSDLEDLKNRVKYAIDSFDNMKEDFENMKWKLEDIEAIVKSNDSLEEKISEIESILAR